MSIITLLMLLETPLIWKQEYLTSGITGIIDIGSGTKLELDDVYI